MQAFAQVLGLQGGTKNVQSLLPWDLQSELDVSSQLINTAIGDFRGGLPRNQEQVAWLLPGACVYAHILEGIKGCPHSGGDTD